MGGIVETAECATCTPWVRLWRNPATGQPIRQVRHDDGCSVFPRITRDDYSDGGRDR